MLQLDSYCLIVLLDIHSLYFTFTQHPTVDQYLIQVCHGGAVPLLPWSHGAASWRGIETCSCLKFYIYIYIYIYISIHMCVCVCDLDHMNHVYCVDIGNW